MSGISELKSAIIHNLEKSGKIEEIKSQLKEQIFNSIASSSIKDDKQESNSLTHKFPQEVFILNYMITEYLEQLELNQSKNVFGTESRMVQGKILSDESMRAQIRDLMKIEEDESNVPLLIKLMWNFQTTFGRDDPTRDKRSNEMSKIVIPSNETKKGLAENKKQKIVQRHDFSIGGEGVMYDDDDFRVETKDVITI